MTSSFWFVLTVDCECTFWYCLYPLFHKKKKKNLSLMTSPRLSPTTSPLNKFSPQISGFTYSALWPPADSDSRGSSKDAARPFWSRNLKGSDEVVVSGVVNSLQCGGFLFVLEKGLMYILTEFLFYLHYITGRVFWCKTIVNWLHAGFCMNQSTQDLFGVFVVTSVANKKTKKRLTKTCLKSKTKYGTKHRCLSPTVMRCCYAVGN